MRPRRVDPWLVVGGALCLGLFLVALYGDRVAPHDPFFLLAQGPNGEERPLAPGEPFTLGSDNAGRDLWSLVLYGARTTLLIAVAAGISRLVAGVAIALVGARVRPLAPALDGAAEVLGSFPATLAALLVVGAFFSFDTPPQAFVVALVAVGWPGPFRLARTELRRLVAAPFTEGARTVGATPGRILVRHHLPHLVPILALATAQQVAASLVAVAELGVLGRFIGIARTVDLSESLTVVRASDAAPVSPVPDTPEWGALLAASRGLAGSGQAIRNYYLGRWVFLVPAAAIAIAAVSVALLGVGVARQWARRDVLHDLTRRRAGAAALALAVVAAPAFLLPSRDAPALALSARARAAVPADADAGAFEALAREAGLAVEAVEHTSTGVAVTRPPRLAVTVAGAARELRPGWDADFAPILYADSGGGTVQAKVVFLGLGVARTDYAIPPGQNPFSAPSFAEQTDRVPDDYAQVEVAGRVVVFVRASFYSRGTRGVGAPDLETQIRSAISRGAAAVLVADAGRRAFAGSGPGRSPNPYLALQRDLPIRSPAGVPVLVVDPSVADLLLAGTGLTVGALLDRFGRVDLGSDVVARGSLARPLDASATIDLSLERRTHTAREIVVRTGAAPGDGALLLWAAAPSQLDLRLDAARALVALARVADAYPRVPVVLVLFDAEGDAVAAGRLVAERLRDVPIHEIVALDTLHGAQLRFITRFGVLQPVIDAYADRLALRHPVTSTTSIATPEPDWPTGFLAAFPSTAYVFVRGDGGDGDRTGDAAALLGYVVGRFAARAPELLR